jgi:hypothetical protein
MAAIHPDVTVQEAGVQRGALYRMLLQPARWPGLAVYLYAKVACMWIYRRKAAQGREKEWNRDDTSRRSA